MSDLPGFDSPPRAGGTASDPQPQPRQTRTWPLELAGLVIVLLNLFLAAPLGIREGYRGAELQGYAIAPLVIPALAVLVSSAFKRMRNRKNRAMLVLGVSIFLLFGILADSPKGGRSVPAGAVGSEPK